MTDFVFFSAWYRLYRGNGVSVLIGCYGVSPYRLFGVSRSVVGIWGCIFKLHGVISNERMGVISTHTLFGTAKSAMRGCFVPSPLFKASDNSDYVVFCSDRSFYIVL